MVAIKTVQLNVVQMEMVKGFQCPGCTNGISPTDCDAFQPEILGGGSCRCSAHSAGTFLLGVARINLGLPRGFCRVRYAEPPPGVKDEDQPRTNIRLMDKPSQAHFDKFNIATWAIEQEGYLIVRTYSPRIDRTSVDVIKGGTIESMCPDAIDVGEFIDEID